MIMSFTFDVEAVSKSDYSPTNSQETLCVLFQKTNHTYYDIRKTKMFIKFF